MLIRPYTIGEEAALRDVFHSSVHQLARHAYTAEQINAWAPASYDQKEWAARISLLQPYVAVIRGRIAGYADLQPSGYIDHFFVAGPVAGQGVGSSLMKHIHAIAESRSIGSLSADVSLAAEKFFASCGFSVEARKTVTVRDVQMQNARMSKILLANPSFQRTAFGGR